VRFYYKDIDADVVMNGVHATIMKNQESARNAKAPIGISRINLGKKD
jgi:hypothetical protein